MDVKIVAEKNACNQQFYQTFARILAEYGRKHREIFETEEYKNWLRESHNPLERKEMASCQSGTTS